MSQINIKKLIFLAIDLFIWSMLAPILFWPIVIFYSYKKFVLHLAKKFRPDLKPLSGNDIMVARGTIKQKPIVDIGFILKVQGEISIEELRQNFHKHFISEDDGNISLSDPFYNLHCTFESFLGYLFIKKVNLDLQKQISEQLLNENVDAQNYFSTWLHSPYKDDNAPRWEMLLLKSKNNRQEYTSYVALRMHHGLVDGFGMLLIVDKLCGQKSPYLVNPEPPTSITEKMSMLLEMPRGIINYWIMAQKVSWPFSEMNNLDKVDKMFISWVTMDLTPLKSIRRQLNVSFATILYVLQTGALRRHLIETGRGDEITDTLPVFHTIPKANHPRTYLTNHWTFAKLHTPFANSDPVARVLQTDEIYNDFIKTRLPVSCSMFYLEFVNLLPTSLCLLNLKIPISIYKASLSSMVRAPSQYRLFGNNVTNIYHTFCTKDLCPQTVLYTTTASHNSQIDVTLAAAPDLVHDQNAMNRMAEKHFRDELQDLLERCNRLANIK